MSISERRSGRGEDGKEVREDRGREGWMVRAEVYRMKKVEREVSGYCKRGVLAW